MNRFAFERQPFTIEGFAVKGKPAERKTAGANDGYSKRFSSETHPEFHSKTMSLRARSNRPFWWLGVFVIGF
ncbi:hypothetical protein, partial [Nitrobacter sp. 62-23]|uniref:hypothetical protein n=1 Tax=Nitrobacter sp. 62-23 TaxID=1895798 RepID=UPI0025EAD27E